MVRSREIVARVTRLVVDGKISRREAAELLESSVRTVHNCVRKYLERGVEGLVDRRGRHLRRLSPEQVQQIVLCKMQRPQRSSRWIRDRLKLEVSVKAVRRVLVKHNLSPARAALERSSKAGDGHDNGQRDY